MYIYILYGDETLIELSDGVDDSSLYIYLMQIFYSFKYLLIPVTYIVFTSTLQHIMSFFSSINTNNAISSVIRVFFSETISNYKNRFVFGRNTYN